MELDEEAECGVADEVGVEWRNQAPALKVRRSNGKKQQKGHLVKLRWMPMRAVADKTAIATAREEAAETAESVRNQKRQNGGINGTP